MFWHLLYHKFGVGTWAKPSSRWRADHFWGPGKPWMPRGYAMSVCLLRLELSASLDPRPLLGHTVTLASTPASSPTLSTAHTFTSLQALGAPALAGPTLASAPTPYPDQTYLKRVELPTVPTTRCQHHLSSRVARLKEDGKWEPSKKLAPSWTPHPQVIGPSTGLAPNFRRTTLNERPQSQARQGNAAIRTLLGAKERSWRAAQDSMRGKARKGDEKDRGGGGG